MSDPQDTAPVEYRPIEGFPGYRVGSDGTVWSCWRKNGRNPALLGESWRQMKPTPDGDGYLALGLFRDRQAHRRKVHLLVLEAFVGTRPAGLEGCHNNGKLPDCRVGNLRWDTHKNNIADRITHGTAPRGERSNVAKLTEGDVKEIKRRLSAGTRQKAIAADYGVRETTISSINAGRTWAWVKHQ